VATKQWRYIELRMVPLHDANGLLSEWIGTLTDVHDRAASERAQQHGRRFLESALSATHDYILFVDRNAIVQWANRSCAEWLGRSVEQLRGMALLELADAAGRESWPRRIKSALAGRTQYYTEHTTLGETNTLLDVSLIPYREDDDRVAGFFWIGVDPGEHRRRLERAMQTAGTI
jgi:PAS domain S-box-containing protein